MTHTPVLLNEVLQYLDPQPGQTVIDGTVGLGGHATALLKAISPNGKLLGVDRDERNLNLAKKNLADFGDRVTLVKDSYANISTHVKAYGFDEVDLILLDIGVSSVHFDDPERGFSFSQDGPLDMRFDSNQELTAEEIVNDWDGEDLARILRVWGEERHARQITNAICTARKEQRLTRTGELAMVIQSVVPRRGRLHPATKTFQALRIAVNDELGELERGLETLTAILKPGGKLAVISFHSLEDRVVKRFIAEKQKLKPITKHVVIATDEEQKQNPRSRSAKMRVAMKT